MQKILMILTHDRLDCLRLCLEMLHKAEALVKFDRVVLLLNGVPNHLRRWVQRHMAEHPEVKWDAIDGSGIRPQGISEVQNACIRKYPGSFYVKVDEDLFVGPEWAERMFEAYDAHRHRGDLALIAPLITNNAYGLHRILTQFYPEKLQAYRRIFGKDPSPEPKGWTWISPHVSDWANREFIEIEQANLAHRKLLMGGSFNRYHTFSEYFSIGCIGYDYRHIERMGGVPECDEPQWCDWIAKNQQVNILDQSQIVLHYAFFVQQRYLDRWPLLEDIRWNNVPDSMGRKTWLNYQWPRYKRMINQVPVLLREKISTTH